MAFPADLDLADAEHSWGVGGLVFDAVDECGVDGVHEPAEHFDPGGAQHGEDGNGDDEASDGVGGFEAGPDSDGAEHDGEGGESVGAGVVAVGDERGGADGVAFTDSVEGDELVTDEADEPSGGDPGDVADGVG